MSEWKETELGVIPKDWNIVKFVDGVNIKNGQVKPTEDPYSEMFHIGSENIAPHSGRFLDVKRNKDLQISSGNYYFTKDDILYSKIRPYFNKVALPAFEGTCSADMYPLRPKNDCFNKDFLFYFLLSNLFLPQAISFQDRTGIPKINREQLGRTLLLKPPLEEQKQIADVLSCLDVKIENLRRQNETLEAIAQTLFKHWFIDFEFPDADGKPYKSSGGEMVDSAIGDIPEGWYVGKLGDIGENIREGVKESDIRPDMSYIGLEHIPRKQIALDTWEQAVDVASNKFWFNKGNILFGKLRPYFHKVGVAFTSGVCSTDILVIDSKQETYFGFLLMLLSSEQFIYYVSLASEGTRMPRTSWEYMKDYPVVIPTLLVLKDFNELLKLLIKKMEVNIFQIQTLTKTRDILLPKLMSGQLRIEE